MLPYILILNCSFYVLCMYYLLVHVMFFFVCCISNAYNYLRTFLVICSRFKFSWVCWVKKNSPHRRSCRLRPFWFRRLVARTFDQVCVAIVVVVPQLVKLHLRVRLFNWRSTGSLWLVVPEIKFASIYPFEFSVNRIRSIVIRELVWQMFFAKEEEVPSNAKMQPLPSAGLCLFYKNHMWLWNVFHLQRTLFQWQSTPTTTRWFLTEIISNDSSSGVVGWCFVLHTWCPEEHPVSCPTGAALYFNGPRFVRRPRCCNRPRSICDDYWVECLGSWRSWIGRRLMKRWPPFDAWRNDGGDGPLWWWRVDGSEKKGKQRARIRKVLSV